MAGITLKVSPDQLKAKAQEIQDQISRFESSWKQLYQTAQNTKSYWVGNASTQHQKLLTTYEEDVARIIRRLKEHPEDLMKMAGVYEEGESAAQQIAQSLPVDIIL